MVDYEKSWYTSLHYYVCPALVVQDLEHLADILFPVKIGENDGSD